jgi:cobalt-zinc-cadmium efflux system membrane fusion protein
MERNERELGKIMGTLRNHSARVAVVALLLGIAAGAAGTYGYLRSKNSALRPVTKPEADDDAHGMQDKHGSQNDHDDHMHAEGAEHQHHEEDLVKLDPEVAKRAGIEVAEAGSGKLQSNLTLPGEIVINADALAHIVPRAGGIAHEVRKSLGNRVVAGEVMAVLDSRELAEAKAADLAAEARLALAEANLERLEGLRAEKIVAEQQYLEARQRLAEAQIEHRTTEVKLHAFGLSDEQVRSLAQEPDTLFSRYEITAPFSGEVFEKHLTLGEVVTAETDVFVVADLSTVWADITVYSQDLPFVEVSDEVIIRAQGSEGEQRGRIIYVSAMVDEGTRTGRARAQLANDDRRWRPGMFVTAELVLEADEVPVLVPDDAIQTIDNRPILFIEERGGFEPRRVVLGRSDGRHWEILAGLVPGDRYVIRGAFVLKAELGKGTAEHEH